MSRIGKLPIAIPQDVNIEFNETNITVKGKFGILQIKIPESIEIRKTENLLNVDLKEYWITVLFLHRNVPFDRFAPILPFRNGNFPNRVVLEAHENRKSTKIAVKKW